MKRIGTLAATAVLTASLLSGCGGGTEAYCDSLADAQDKFSDLGSDASSIEDFREVAEDLESDAPDEVKDDWGSFTDAFDEMEASLEDAGLSFDELGEISETGEMPEGVDEQALMDFNEEMGKFGETLDSAGENITEHAKDECDVDLE